MSQRSLWDQVLQLTHDVQSAAHFGWYKSFHFLTHEFLVALYQVDVTHCVFRQLEDQLGKPQSYYIFCLLLWGLGKQSPWIFNMDLPSSQGNSCILVVVDLFTKLARAIPCPGFPSTHAMVHLYF